jgi:hypothetical protein
MDAADMARKRWQSVGRGERSRIMWDAALARWRSADAAKFAEARKRAEFARQVRADRLAARRGPQLRRIARAYVWWKAPEQALKDRRHFLLSIMQYATWQDAMAVLSAFGRGEFRKALRSALPGILSDKSWRFWHMYLGMADSPEGAPPMPIRKIVGVRTQT